MLRDGAGHNPQYRRPAAVSLIPLGPSPRFSQDYAFTEPLTRHSGYSHPLDTGMTARSCY